MFAVAQRILIYTEVKTLVLHPQQPQQQRPQGDVWGNCA
jgi:hypothetical protein